LLKAQDCSVTAGVVADPICWDGIIQLDGDSSGIFSVNPTWELIVGLSVSIENAADLNSLVTFYIPSTTYTFRISASCGDGVNVHKDINITVKPEVTEGCGCNMMYDKLFQIPYLSIFSLI